MMLELKHPLENHEDQDLYRSHDLYTLIIQRVYDLTTGLLLKKKVSLYKPGISPKQEDLDILLKEKSSFGYLLQALSLHKVPVPLYFKLLLETVQTLVTDNSVLYNFKNLYTDKQLYQKEVLIPSFKGFLSYKLELELQALIKRCTIKELHYLLKLLQEMKI